MLQQAGRLETSPPRPSLYSLHGTAAPPLAEEARASQGQGLVAALREVPAVFFQEGFELDRPEVWGLVGEVESDEGRQEALDKLGHYLVRWEGIAGSVGGCECAWAAENGPLEGAVPAGGVAPLRPLCLAARVLCGPAVPGASWRRAPHKGCPAS